MGSVKNKHKTLKFSRPIVVTALVFIALLAAAAIQTTENMTVSTQSVLGDSEQSEGQKRQRKRQKSPQKKLRKKKRKGAKQGEEQQKQQSEGSKRETEIETADGQKIKTKIEKDGTTKIEIENGTVKLKYRVENGQLVLKAENEKGEEVEIEDDELEELENDVEDELGDDDVKLVLTADSRLAVTQNQVAAVTDFPLSINVETKELIVTTPAGQKIVTVLPDVAIKNLLATGIINKVETLAVDATTQGQLGALTGVVKLEIRDDKVVYKVRGTKIHRMLGFIPIDTQTTAFVSADNGAVVAQQRSLLANIVDFLSP